MPILLILLALGVLAYLWLSRRGSTLTRLCRWREDRASGADRWHCAACGARCETKPGKTPRACLRPR